MLSVRVCNWCCDDILCAMVRWECCLLSGVAAWITVVLDISRDFIVYVRNSLLRKAMQLSGKRHGIAVDVVFVDILFA